MARRFGTQAEDGFCAWWLAPLNTTTPRTRALLLALLSLLTAAWSLLLIRPMEPPFGIPDTASYYHLAEGKVSLVPQPFASRPLAPLLARGIAAGLHLSLKHGFYVLGAIAFGFTLLVVYGLLLRSPAPRWFLLVLPALPLWPELLHELALPDLPYAALLCGMLLLLARGRIFWAAACMLPLMLARESTSLTLFCLLAVGWRQLGWRGCLLAVGSTALGAVLVKHLTAGAPGNAEHLPEFLYLPAKVPWNALRLVGVVPWSNLYPYLCTTPTWTHALHLGPVRQVGVCQVNTDATQQAVAGFLMTFGVLFPLFLYLWQGRAAVPKSDLLLRFSLLYGGLSFALAPLLGVWYVRLFGYAWPLFLVALPRLFPVRPEGEGAGARPLHGVLAALLFILLGWGVEVVATFGSFPAQVTWGAGLTAATVLWLMSPVGAQLRVSRGVGAGVPRGKLKAGKIPQQADFS